jgi:hypothetical protein
MVGNAGAKSQEDDEHGQAQKVLSKYNSFTSLWQGWYSRLLPACKFITLSLSFAATPCSFLNLFSPLPFSQIPNLPVELRKQSEYWQSQSYGRGVP